MNSQINKNKIANIKDQNKMIKAQDEMLVMVYRREQYNSMVLRLMNGLPGLVKQYVAQSKAGTIAEDGINDNDNDN